MGGGAIRSPRGVGKRAAHASASEGERTHGEPVLERGRRSVNVRLIAESWERIGQFCAANRELGHVMKTGRLLQRMSEPQRRARVRRGLVTCATPGAARDVAIRDRVPIADQATGHAPVTLAAR